jgi:hypothetical protein
MSSGKSVFISYRRDDSAGHAGRLFDFLSAKLNNEAKIFFDVGGIQAGDDWQDVIKNEIECCSVMLVIIGQHWLKVYDRHGRRRIDLDDDTVRYEVVEGLKNSNVTVIPILVHGADIPDGAGLPQDMANLLRANAFPIDDPTFTEDASRLERRIRSLLVDRQDTSIGLVARGTIRLDNFILPPSWEWGLLKDIALIKKGRTEKQESNIGDDYPVYNPSGIIQWIDSFEFDGEYILVPSLASDWSRIFIQRTNGRFSVTQSVYAIYPNPEIVVFDYLWALLAYVDFNPYVSAGTTIPRLTLSSLSQINVPLPPFEVQREVFSTLSDIRDSVQEIRQKAEDQIRASEELEIALVKQIIQGIE